MMFDLQWLGVRARWHTLQKGLLIIEKVTSRIDYDQWGGDRDHHGKVMINLGLLYPYWPSDGPQLLSDNTNHFWHSLHAGGQNEWWLLLWKAHTMFVSTPCQNSHRNRRTTAAELVVIAIVYRPLRYTTHPNLLVLEGSCPIYSQKLLSIMFLRLTYLIVLIVTGVCHILLCLYSMDLILCSNLCTMYSHSMYHIETNYLKTFIIL